MAEITPKPFICRRHWTLAERLDHYIDRSGGPAACWPWLGGRNFRGYGKIKWKYRTISAHRLTWISTHGPIPEGMLVCHHCDNPPCCNPAHLFCDTSAANNADMVRKGRARYPGGPAGEANFSAKLTEADVRAIRAAEGSLVTIAKRFGVGQTTVFYIRSGIRWKHLP